MFYAYTLLLRSAAADPEIFGRVVNVMTTERTKMKYVTKLGFRGCF